MDSKARDLWRRSTQNVFGEGGFDSRVACAGEVAVDQKELLEQFPYAQASGHATASGFGTRRGSSSPIEVRLLIR